MLTCIHCGKDTSEDYNFCEHCFEQLKCSYSDCSNLLKHGAPICLKCGRKIGAQQVPQSVVNVYKEDIKQTSDYFESHRSLEVDTEAVAYFAPFVVNQMQPRTMQPQVAMDGNNGSVKPVLMSQTHETTIDNTDKNLDHLDEILPPEKKDHDRLALSLFDIFEEDKLIAKPRDFKGATKKEQQKRLIVLYGWAYNDIFGRAVPDRKHFSIVAEKAKALDKNFARYLRQTIGEYFNHHGEEGYRLATPGESKAKLILAELDDDTKIGFNYCESNPRSGKKPGPMSRAEVTTIKEWAERDIDEGEIDIRNLSDPTNCALFALWAITIKMKAVQSVKPREAYQFMKEKYNTISVNLKSFTSSLSRDSNKNYFNRTPEGQYYLTPLGEQLVEEWRNGQKIISKHKRNGV